MRVSFAVYASAAFAAAAIVPIDSKPDGTSCLPRTADSTDQLGDLKQYLGSKDSLTTLARNSAGLASVNPDSIVYSNDERKCTRAVIVIDSLLSTHGSGRKVIMFKIGSRWAAESPTFSNEQGVNIIFFFDSRMNYDRRVAMGGG